MKKKNIISLIFNVGLPILLGFIISLITRDDISYLQTLNRNINVPSIVFPIVWSILYILMGIWMFLFSRDFPLDKKNQIIYWISLVINLLFSLILFSFRQIILAFIDVIILLIMIIYLFLFTLSKDKKYAYLLLPYIVWLFIAFNLMLDIVVNN